ncbi:MAG: VWA domain-containing protein [Acidobacteria bacterium]|nr:MAG: VWA domain-containing protein [Acidobacteriota bacterium]
MRLTGSTPLAFGTALSLALLSPLGTSQAGKPPRGARLAVVAYHDSRLLTLCPVFGKDVIQSNVLSSGMKAKVSVNYPPTGVQSIAFNQLDGLFGRISLPFPAGRSTAGGPGGLALPPATSELDRLARDLDLEQRLAERFRSRKTYTILGDPSEADFVFLAESTYVSLSGGTGGASGASFSGIIGGDRPRNWRESILAIAVPGAFYRQHAGDGSTLSSGRTWSGLAVAGRPIADGRPTSTIKAASPEDLVDRFHDGGAGLPDYLPVCAATTGTIRSIHDPAESIPALAGEAPGVRPDATGGARPARAGDAAALPRFRSSVTLVTVPVAVTGANGAVVGDLPLSSFRVFEDDVEQKVDRLDRGSVATDIALLIDSSAGMREPRESIRSSAAAFATALRAADRAMVVKFGSQIQVFSELTGDRAGLQAALAAAGPGGGTRLYDALALVAADRLSRMDGRKTVVVLTDGRDTQSQLTDMTGALAAMEAIDAPVYVIRYETPDASSLIPPGAYGIRRWLVPFADPGAEGEARAAADAFLLQLASRTGGQLYAARADAQVPEMIAHIAEALSDQVVLGYYPANDKLDGTYRRIRVAVDCEGCTVRARTGYRAGVPR